MNPDGSRGRPRVAALRLIRDRCLPTMSALIVVACSGGRTDVDPHLQEWSIAAEPDLVIGADNDPRSDFYRIVGVARLPDGGTVVADGGNQTISVYGAAGELSHRFGRAGKGPGEFTSLAHVTTQGDTILAVDHPLMGIARLQSFHSSHGLAGVVTVRPVGEPAPVAVIDVVSPSALLVSRGGARVLKPEMIPPKGVVVRRTEVWGVLDIGADSQVVNWLGEFPGNSYYSYELPPGFPVRRGMGAYTLGPSAGVRSSGQRIWIGDTGTGLLKILDGGGSLVTQVEFPLPPRPFDEAALETARAAELARAGTSGVAQEYAKRMLSALYSPELLPATAPRFGRMTAGPDGEMWVECFSEIPTAAHCGVVFDPAGRAIAQATIPAGLELQAVDMTRLIGVRTDSLGVQRIAAYRLRRQ